MILCLGEAKKKYRYVYFSNYIVVSAPLRSYIYSILELHVALLCRYFEKLSNVLTFVESLPVTR